MNAKLYFLFTVFIICLLSCNSKKETITPEIKNISESVYSTGFIKSVNQYEVFGSRNGIVEKIFVTEGMRVKKGDPIFQMENENLKVATENAKLASRVSDIKINSNKLLDAKKAIDLAQRNLSNDSLQYERQKNLWSKNIGSKVQLEQKELSYEKSKTEFDRANTNYEDLKRQLNLASEQSKNNLEIAELMEEDFIIRSEVDGVVYKINKEVGELINGQEPSAIIGTEEFIIELSIDEIDIIKVKKGQQVIIRMDSYESEVFEARIIAVDLMMNKRTRLFQVLFLPISPKSFFQI